MPVHNTPKFTLWRDNITAVETIGALSGSLNGGLNFSGFDRAAFMVYPSGGAQPTIDVVVWDPLTQSWVAPLPASDYTFTAPAPDTPFTFTVPAYGRGLYAFVSALAGGSVDIAAAGHATGTW
jgi:hypothetical protein